MLTETETEETNSYFVTFLSLVALQLGVGRTPELPWLRLRVEGNCYLKMMHLIVTHTNHVIDWPGFTLRGALGTLEIFAKSSCQI